MEELIDIELTAKQKKEAAMTPAQKVERSLIKKFKKEVWRKFTGAINDYHMIVAEDHIAVLVDQDARSVLLAKEFAEIAKHGIQNFTYDVLVTEAADTSLLELLAIPMNHRVKDTAEGRAYAKQLGCNKITAVEDFDDVISTIVANMLYEAKVETVLPVEEADGLTILRPLYLTQAQDIVHWIQYNALDCSLAKKEELEAARAIIAQLEAENKYVPMNIFRSVENVNLATLIAYTKEGVTTDFRDRYEEIVEA